MSRPAPVSEPLFSFVIPVSTSFGPVLSMPPVTFAFIPTIFFIRSIERMVLTLTRERLLFVIWPNPFGQGEPIRFASCRGGFGVRARLGVLLFDSQRYPNERCPVSVINSQAHPKVEANSQKDSTLIVVGNDHF